MTKSPILALFLALFPGFGHIYLGYRWRGVLYTLFFLGSLFCGFIAGIIVYSDTLFIGFFLIAAIVWLINMMDIVMTLVMKKQGGLAGTTNNDQAFTLEDPKQKERFSTILLSFIPGIGHFYLGLTYRGLTILAAFFGIIAMVFFVSVLTSSIFLIFLLAIPIIWIYSMFDVIQLLNKKQQGIDLLDTTIFDDFDRFRDDSKKSRMLTTLLAIFPGAGHMYLGLQNRGLQLMASFLLSIYILDVLHLSIFLFVIPIIWFFSFFDALQLINRSHDQELEDIPVFKHLANYQKWLGIGLILLGVFYLIDSTFLPIIADNLREIFNIDVWYYYQQYFQVSIVCFLLILGGIKLISGSKKKEKVEK